MAEPTEYDVDVARWTPGHPRWRELIQACEDLDQGGLDEKQTDYHLGFYTVVAFTEDQVIGFLRFWTQQIGVDEEKPPLLLDGEPVIEARSVAIGVRPPFRRRGIGRRLQEAAISWARELGCYQLRSRSCYSCVENHALKLSMGFCIQPAVGEKDGNESAYFVLPLKIQTAKVKRQSISRSAVRPLDTVRGRRPPSASRGERYA